MPYGFPFLCNYFVTVNHSSIVTRLRYGGFAEKMSLMSFVVCFFLFFFLIIEFVDVGYGNVLVSSVGQSMGSTNVLQW